MPTDPYGQGIAVTALTDAPDASALAAALAGLSGLTPRTVMRFASASARSAALTGATAPVAGMTTWLTAEKRLDCYDGSAWVSQVPDLVTSTSGATAASGFSLISFSAYKDGRSVLVNLTVARTGAAINSDDQGNIADTDIATLLAAWRPPELIFGSVGDGFGQGECSISTAGLITVRAWSSNGPGSSTVGLIAGRNIRLTKSFIQTT
ncbi:MAG TPA: hypothetical protein VK698_39785 [Kofleriaceae bacterium]|nr:hypothetical protein [Kofleriaceae bacterium]